MHQLDLECRFQPGGQVVFANSAYCSYFRCTIEDLLTSAQPPHLAQSQDGLPQLNLRALGLQHSQICHESRVKLQTGETVWQQWHNQALFDDQEHLVEIRAVGHDITRYKLIEERLKQQINREQALGRIVDRVRQSLNIDDIFASATTEAKDLLRCDRVSIYRFTPDWSGYFVVESVSPGWLPLVGEGIRTVWTDSYLQEHQGGRYRNHETFTVDDIYFSGHSPCHLDILDQFQVRAYTIVPIFVQDQLWGLLSAYQNTGPRRWEPDDIALLSQVAHHIGLALHHVDLLEQARQAKEAAEKASRAKSEFLSHMSHELRTPLNAIIGYAQFLLRDKTLKPEQQGYIKTVNESGEHLLSLINNILSMAKIESGQLEGVYTDFSLQDTVQRLVDFLAVKAAEKQITLNTDLAPDLPSYIHSDQRKLQQILLNLLDNAIKFTAQGSVNLSVTVDSGVNTGGNESYWLLFSVADTGPGIAPAQAQLLFQPFSQTDSGLAIQEGTGLGLAISRKFAHLLGGNLVLESSSSRGSTFHLRLPVEVIDTVQIKPRTTLRQVVHLAPDQPPVRILVVEDKASNRHLMVKLLQSVGFEVRAVTNGAEAIAQWQDWHPHLIFMDLRMPVLDGYQATQQIKASAGEQAPIILALTASAFDDEEQAALQSGCDDFLRKPIRADVLFEAINQHLGVIYQYDDSEVASPSTLPTTSLDLTLLPAEWIDQLYQAALTVNNATLLSLIDQLPEEHVALAQTLRSWVRNFRCDQIVELVEQVRGCYSATTEADNSDC